MHSQIPTEIISKRDFKEFYYMRKRKSILPSQDMYLQLNTISII